MQYSIVTGGSSGLGAEFVYELNQLRYCVIIIDINSPIHDKQTKNLYFKFNLLLHDQFDQQFSQYLIAQNIIKKQIKYVFLNAGFGQYKKFENTTLFQKQQFMDVNFYQHFNLLNYFDTHYSNIHIIITSSILAFTFGAFFSLYSMCKQMLYQLQYMQLTQKSNKLLIICPTALQNTQFYNNQQMLLANNDQVSISIIGQIQYSFFSMPASKVAKKCILQLKKQVKQNDLMIIGLLNKVVHIVFQTLDINLNSILWLLLSLLNRKDVL